MITFEFVRDFVELNSTCKLLSTQYINYDEKLKFQCSCGNIFEASFDKFKNRNKRQCNECGKLINNEKKRLSFNYVREFIENNSECLLLSAEDEYKNNMSKLKFKCKCGNIFIASFSNFQTHDKRRCNFCSKQNAINKIQTNISDIYNVYTEKGFIPLFDKCKNTNEKLPAIDKNGYKIFVSPSQLKTKGTNIFNISNIFSYENMLKYIETNEPTQKLLSDRYIGAHEQYSFLCEHNHIYKTTWSEFLTGTRCSICNKSKGEKKISNVLDFYSVYFIQQYKFKDCKLKIKLPFDFYLPLYNICIEYQGIQHYEAVDYFGGKDQLVIQQNNDQIKRDYCLNNNIKLIEIPYWDFESIEQILLNELHIKEGELSA